MVCFYISQCRRIFFFFLKSNVNHFYVSHNSYEKWFFSSSCHSPILPLLKFTNESVGFVSIPYMGHTDPIMILKSMSMRKEHEEDV